MSVRRVAVLTAMVQEMRPLKRPLALVDAPGRPGVLAGRYRGVEVVAAVTGIGTALALRSTTVLLEAHEVDHVLMVGIAGSVDPTLRIGDLVTPEVVIDDATNLELRPSTTGSRVPSGGLLTTDELLNDPEQLRELGARGIVAVDMETATVGAVCEERSVPWSVHRAISDRAGDPATDAAVLALANDDGSADLRAAIGYVLRHPAKVPHLSRLGRGTKAATRTAADAAVAALDEIT